MTPFSPVSPKAPYQQALSRRAAGKVLPKFDFRFLSLALLVAVVHLASCSSIDQNDGKHLPLALEDFNSGIRWKQTPMFAKYADPEMAGRLVSQIVEISSDVEFAEFEIMDVRVAQDEKTALVLVRFSWYAPGDLILVSGLEIQEWRKVSDRWYIVGQRPPLDGDTQRSIFVASETIEVKKER